MAVPTWYTANGVGEPMRTTSGGSQGVWGLREIVASTFEVSNLLEQQRQGVTTRKLAGWAAIFVVPTARQ